MKKILLTILVLLLSASLAFSAGKQEKEEIPGKPYAGRELIVFTGPDGPPENKRIEPYVRKFEEETGIKVQWVEMTFDDLHQKFSTMAAAKSSAVDVIGTWVAFTAEFASAGWLEDITDKIDPDLRNDLSSALNSCKYKGRVYGLPESGDIQMLFYNTKMFKEAGLDPNNPPKTWDEFIKAARLLKKDTDGDGKIDQWGFQSSGVGDGMRALQDYQIFYYMCGLDTLFDNDDKPLFNSPQGLKALKSYMQLYDEELVGPEAFMVHGYIDQFQLWTKAISGMAFGWASLYSYATTHEASKVKDVTAVAPIPAIDRSASITGTQGFVISKFSKNKDIALELCKFIANKESTKDMLLRTGFLPTRKSVYDDPEVKKSELSVMLAAAAKQEKYYSMRFAAPYAAEIENEVLGMAIVKAIKHEMTPEEALKWAEAKAIEVIAKYK